jgi:hydroxymethylpyrimidine pyrophosphatase-like HAD family hydrolase
MGEIRDAFGFGAAICCNGAMLYDLINDVILEEWMISIDDQTEIVQRMRAVMPEISFAVESNDHYQREIGYIPKWDIGLDNVGVEKIEDGGSVITREDGGDWKTWQVEAHESLKKSNEHHKIKMHERYLKRKKDPIKNVAMRVRSCIASAFRYKWLKKNAIKYGFTRIPPKGKGEDWEAWHWEHLGNS